MICVIDTTLTCQNFYMCSSLARSFKYLLFLYYSPCAEHQFFSTFHFILRFQLLECHSELEILNVPVEGFDDPAFVATFDFRLFMVLDEKVELVEIPVVFKNGG